MLAEMCDVSKTWSLNLMTPYQPDISIFYFFTHLLLFIYFILFYFLNKALTEAGRSGTSDLPKKFFQVEYSLNHFTGK